MIKKILIIPIILIMFFATACSSKNTSKPSDLSTQTHNNQENNKQKQSELTNSKIKNIIAEGSIVIDGKDFSEGVAWIKLSHPSLKEIWACVDTSGKILFNLQSNTIEPLTNFGNGVSLLSDNSIINKRGIIIASPEKSGYDELILTNDEKNDDLYNDKKSYDFYNDGFQKKGLTVVKKFDNNQSKTLYGIIDNKGKWYLELTDKFNYVTYVYDTLIEISKDDEFKPVYFDANSKQFLSQQDMSNSLGYEFDPNNPIPKVDIIPTTNDSNGNFAPGIGIKNKNGEIKILKSNYNANPGFEYIVNSSHENGYIAANIWSQSTQDGSQYPEGIILIDDNGKVLFADDIKADEFYIKDGIIKYCPYDGKPEFYDLKGNRLPKISETFRDFSEGYALMVEKISNPAEINGTKYNDQYYYIDKNGNRLW